MKVIRQAEVYAPDYLGKKDILLSEDKIIAIEDSIEGGFSGFLLKKSMAQGYSLFPALLTATFIS